MRYSLQLLIAIVLQIPTLVYTVYKIKNYKAIQWIDVLIYFGLTLSAQTVLSVITYSKTQKKNKNMV